MPDTITALAWYKKADYPEILRIMTDADGLHDTYQEWLKSAERVERQLSRAGVCVVRVFIDPKAFPAWCVIRGLKPDSGARSRFASEQAARSS